MKAYKFLMVPIVEKDGSTSDLPIKPEAVIMVHPITIPGLLKDSLGDPIPKAVSALDFGMKMMPIDMNVLAAVAMIEKAIEENRNG